MIASLLFPEMGSFKTSSEFNLDLTEFTVQHLIDKELESQTKNFVAEKSNNCVANNLFADKAAPQFESRAAKKERLDQSRSTLDKWNSLKKATMSKDLEQDLQILKLRKWLNPKQMYKSEGKKMPKYFETGTIIDDKFNSKNNMKRGEKKARLFDEFKETDGELGHSKKKFKEIQLDRMKNSRNKKWVKLKRAAMKSDGNFKKVKIN